MLGNRFEILQLIYCLAVFCFTTVILKDWLATLLLFSTLLHITGMLELKKTAIINEAILIVQFIIKIVVVVKHIDTSKYKLDNHCIQQLQLFIQTGEISYHSFLYICLHVANIYACFRALFSSEIEKKCWGPLMTQIMTFLMPMLMYCLSLSAVNPYVCIGWALTACFKVLGLAERPVHIFSCLMIASMNLLNIPDTYQIYIGTFEMQDQNLQSTILTIMCIILLLLNVNQSPHPQYIMGRKTDTNLDRYKLLSKRTAIQQSKNKKQSAKLTILASVILCLLTNSLGNILILLAIYTNIPNYKAKRFSYLMGIGIIISVVMQPMQISYFLYIYIVVKIIGEDIKATDIIQFQMHSFGLMLHLYRIYLMLNHVSFLNFLIGLCRSSTVVLLTLSIRISFRYLQISSVFMGTNDNYGLETTLISLEALPDAILWVYLILMCLHSPTAKAKYSDTNITNILMEYPIVNKFPQILKIFRAFNWLSYVVFSLLVLSQIPSLYLLVHILLLALAIFIDLKVQQCDEQANQSSILRNIWNAIFYFTCIIIFTKYFYLLKQYKDTSQAIQTLLKFLDEHKLLFGLSTLDTATSGFKLSYYFFYDITVILLSWVNVYILNFKIYAAYRQMIVRNQKLSVLIDQQKQFTLQEQQILRKKNLYYFYNQFIRPIDLRKFLKLAVHHNLQKSIKDCAMGVCFSVVMCGYYFEANNTKFLVQIPFFFFFGLYYVLKYTKQYNPSLNYKIISLLSIWSLINLFFSYVANVVKQIFWTHPSPVINDLIAIYMVTIILMVIVNIYNCLPQVTQRQQQIGHAGHIIIKLLLPFKLKNVHLYKQILNLMSSFTLAFCFSFFCTNIFSPDLVSTLLHPLVVGIIFCSRLREGQEESWMYILSIIGLFDLWNEDFTAYFTVMCVGLFYCFRAQQLLTNIRINRQSANAIHAPHANQQQQPLIGQVERVQTIEKNKAKQWTYYNCYCTFIWLLPVMLDLLWLLGIVWLSPSQISALLIFLFLPKLVYQLMYERAEWLKYVFYAILFMATVFFVFQLAAFYQKRFHTENYSDFFNQGIGIFLIFSAYFSYFIIVHKSDLYISRSEQAKYYWEIKKQMVGQLGSQLHNEKKLLLLQKIYHAKQRLSQKVNKISIHLRQHGKQPFYHSLDNMSRDMVEEQQYELFSNMLLVLDRSTLQRCFLMLNQYIPAKLRKGNIFEQARQFRQQILRDYRGSFKQAFMRLKIEYSEREQLEYSQSSDKSEVGIEKISQMNKLFKQCYLIISKQTAEFNPVLRYILQNMQIFALAIVVGWNLFGGVYTIPSTLAIFGWAIVLENKTTVIFWLSIMVYAGLVLILKQLLFYLSHSYFFQFVFYYHADDYLYEYLVIFVSVSQIVFLQLGGTQEKSYSERESIYDAFYRTALNKAGRDSEMDKQVEFMDIYKNLKQPSKHSFIYRVFAKARFKPGKDFYPLMSGIQLILLLYTFFFYDLMEFQSQKNRQSIGQILTINQFSSHMVIILFIQIMIMVIDRLLVSLNLVDQTNQALENFFLSFSFNIGTVKHDPPKQIDNISVFDALLIVKYLFHLCLLFAINFFVYFYIPSAGLSKSLTPTCNNSQCSKSYFYLSIFLLFYLMYFMVSGLQIKHGFNRNKCKNVLMQKFHYINYYIYKAFTAIPFAWEFKKICDWTVTSTALPLFHWMKFEDINAKMYETKCQAEMIKNKPLGAPWNKYLLGPLGFISILLLIFGPITMYSPANPFSIKDTIIGAEAKLFLQMNGRYEYNFFSTSHSVIKDNVDNDYGVDLTDKNLFYIKMSEFPDQNFLFSEPAVDKLNSYISKSIKNGQNSFKFIFSFKIIQQEGGQSIIEWASKKLSKQQLKDLNRMLKHQTNQMIVTNFFSPFPGEIAPQSILIRTPQLGEYYEVSIVAKNKITSDVPIQGKPVYFYYLTSNKFKLGFGIVTFYLTYVLLISRLLRFYLTDAINSTLYDGCYLEGILMLCEAVRQARIVQNFIKQESFYFQLIDLMRHPKVFKQITGDFVDYRKKYI